MEYSSQLMKVHSIEKGGEIMKSKIYGIYNVQSRGIMIKWKNS
jgi:hypothetical protein